jgi:hypothetical protein
MAYQYQSFGSGAVFTGAQAQQIEDNIRDHRHGVDGVGPSGAAWAASSKASAFSVVSTDAGTLFKCYGDYAVQFAAAATLGTAFGAAFKNVGSGRIQLNAASGQFIDNNSYYALCPGEGVSVTSDGTELTVIGGQDHAKLCRVTLPGSAAAIDILKCFPGDFHAYELVAFVNQTAASILQMRVSVDSGSTFISGGYANGVGAQTQEGNLSTTNSNSKQLVYSRVQFGNGQQISSIQNGYSAYSLRRTGTTIANDSNFFLTASAMGMISGIRLLTDAGGLTADTTVELFGRGRVRR